MSTVFCIAVMNSMWHARLTPVRFCSSDATVYGTLAVWACWSVCSCLPPSAPRVIPPGLQAATHTCKCRGHLARLPYLRLQSYELIKGNLARFSDTRNSSVPTAVLVHGILGSRRNLQGFARMIVEVSRRTTRFRSLGRLCVPALQPCSAHPATYETRGGGVQGQGGV